SDNSNYFSSLASMQWRLHPSRTQALFHSKRYANLLIIIIIIIIIYLFYCSIIFYSYHLFVLLFFLSLYIIMLFGLM
ncbi:MAG: hypothetical protein N7Q72_05450, partial [Spiroplasma sp. Tabriz.8]|nr:hypothetical protein [Spiroplasma sp. Tabriz.8]